MPVVPSIIVPVSSETDHFRYEHRNRLTQHRCLGFNAANAPSEHGSAIDHCRVAVRADQRVGVGDLGAVLIRIPVQTV